MASFVTDRRERAQRDVTLTARDTNNGNDVGNVTELATLMPAYVFRSSMNRSRDDKRSSSAAELRADENNDDDDDDSGAAVSCRGSPTASAEVPQRPTTPSAGSKSSSSATLGRSRSTCSATPLQALLTTPTPEDVTESKALTKTKTKATKAATLAAIGRSRSSCSPTSRRTDLQSKATNTAPAAIGRSRSSCSASRSPTSPVVIVAPADVDYDVGGNGGERCTLSPRDSRCSEATVSPSYGGVKSPMLSGLQTPDTRLWSDGHLARLPSDKDLSNQSPKTSKSRNEQFGRLFPDISDTVINSYHCAFVGDVLLQGILYITQNWFCFHSKLLGKKSIRIPVSAVTEIVKVNIAMIIPNAVGIHTHSEKYVFGSLIARKNTFRVLIKVWEETIKGCKGRQNGGDVFDVANNNNLKPQSVCGSENSNTSSSKSGCSQDHRASFGTSDDTASYDPEDAIDGLSEESTTHLSCVGADDTNSLAPFVDSQHPRQLFQEPVKERKNEPPVVRFEPVPSDDHNQQRPPACRERPTRNATDIAAPELQRSEVNLAAGGGQQQHGRLLPHATGHRRRTSLQLRNNRGPHTVTFLVIFTVIVLFLTFVAVYLAYRLIHLQARIDAYSSVSPGRVDFADGDAEIYRLRHEEHLSAVERLRSIIEAHIRILDKVNQSLRSLCMLQNAEGVFINDSTSESNSLQSILANASLNVDGAT